MLLLTVGDAPDTPQPLRRDAERNRARILEAAAELFAARGLDVTLDEVARHAGVGVGTVYRRFDGKEALLDALFEEKLGAVLAVLRAADAEPDPWTAFEAWITGICELFAADRGLKTVMLSQAPGRARADRARAEIMPVVIGIMQRAQAAGQLRADLAITDVPLIEFIVTAAAEFTRAEAPEVWRRSLAIVLDGLRQRRDEPSELPAEPLAVDQLAAVTEAWR